tara:strand:+ start:1012 stop:1197 length:186 start_codon:yes stop_codon:yes gene_type:complete
MTKDKNFVSSVLFTKASKELEDEVVQELNIPDPPPEKAAAILKEVNEDTKEHDGKGSSGDN